MTSPSKTMELRDYQKKSVAALWNYYRTVPQGVPLIVAPTGAGKSVIVAEIIRRLLDKRPHYKTLVCSHRKEIIEQNAKELHGLLPNAPIGIYSAGIGLRQIRKVTFANVQSIYKKDVEADLFILDECHLLSKNTDSMYQKLINKLLKKNPRMKIVGLTATPFRLDQGPLVGNGGLFSDICYDISIQELISQGHLTKIISRPYDAVDLRGVSKSGYDYNQTQMSERFETLMDKHLDDVIKAGEGRKSWLIFCSGVEHTEKVTEALKRLGVKADFVVGSHLPMERDLKLNRFKSGETRALCNCDVLTTGFNYPGIDMVVLMRATQSAALYIQMVGRGSRIALGKKDCLVVDFGGNIDRHGPIDLVKVKSKKGGDKVEISHEPVKECPVCHATQSIRNKRCIACDYEFPEASCRLEIKASESPVLSGVEELRVKNWEAKIHRKTGKPDSLKIIYDTERRWVMDFFCFDHGGWATRMAINKWRERGGQSPAPLTVAEAHTRAERELIPPSVIKVIKDGKYDRIIGVVRKEEEELSINI